jgi:hypothetical protein
VRQPDDLDDSMESDAVADDGLRERCEGHSERDHLFPKQMDRNIIEVVQM